MQLPPYTDQQEQTISYLYQFRYLLVNQFIKLFGHNDKKRIQIFLNDLVSKKYIAKIINEEIARGYVYCLDTKAGHILKKDEDVDNSVLGRLYKEKDKEVPFIKKLLFIASIYLYFLSQKEKKSELNFFTSQELRGYEYFPDPKPSAYIEQVEGKETSRYFLEYFDEYSLPFVARERIQYYLEYSKNGDWQANTDNAPFPSVLFVLPTEKFKKHIQYYSKAVFEKNIGDDIDLFLATKSEIKTGQINWKDVTEEKHLPLSFRQRQDKTY